MGLTNERHRVSGLLAAAVTFALSASTFAAPAWESTLSKDPPGNFPEPRPLRAHYAFGWSGFTAATGDVNFSKTGNRHFELEGKGRTSGLVRALWKLDAHYQSTVDAETLRPIESSQVELYRSKKFVTKLAFTNAGVIRTRTEGINTPVTKTTPFEFPDLFDLHSALLYLRSQPLKDHAVYRIAVYPATSAYVATVTVLGRERTSVRAGSYNSIKLDLQLKRIGKNLDLEPHRKFRHATAWVSDDANRILLRLEAQIFVGSVFAELQSIQFDSGKS
jgi:hypothetical protein